MALIQGEPFPQHGPSPLLHPKPHPLDSSTPRASGAGVLLPWSVCSSPHDTLPCSHPCPTALGPHQVLINHRPHGAQNLHLPHPGHPSSSVFTLTQGGGVTPEPCSPLAPQSQALIASSLQSLPFPHSRNTALGPLPTSLAFITLSLVPRPQWTLTISILYPKSLFVPLGQQAFPTGSLLPGPHPLLAGCLARTLCGGVTSLPPAPPTM